MKSVARVVMMGCLFGIAGCTAVPQGSTSVSRWDGPNPSKEAHLRRLHRHEARPTQVVQAKPDQEPTTTGSATSGPAVYSPAWWAQERVRQDREDEHLKRVMNICRGC